MRLFKVLLLAAGAAALKTPTSAWRATTRFTGETFREPTARHMFGKKGGGESEAERLDREQEELNQRWAKESAQETQLMSIFGVVTSIPARSRRRCIRSLRESPSNGRARRAVRRAPRGPRLARRCSLVPEASPAIPCVLLDRASILARARAVGPRPRRRPARRRFSICSTSPSRSTMTWEPRSTKTPKKKLSRPRTTAPRGRRGSRAFSFERLRERPSSEIGRRPPPFVDVSKRLRSSREPRRSRSCAGELSSEVASAVAGL